MLPTNTLECSRCTRNGGSPPANTVRVLQQKMHAPSRRLKRLSRCYDTWKHSRPHGGLDQHHTDGRRVFWRLAQGRASFTPHGMSKAALFSAGTAT